MKRFPVSAVQSPLGCVVSDKLGFDQQAGTYNGDNSKYD